MILFGRTALQLIPDVMYAGLGAVSFPFCLSVVSRSQH